MTSTARFFLFAFAVIAMAACSGPRAAFLVPSEPARAGEWVTLTNETKDAETYLWKFGDGTTSTEANPKHRYWSSGRYEVTLLTTAAGKSSSKKMDIQILPPEECLVLLETDMGDMIIKLYDDTPAHRDNFLKLAEEGFYDGLLFHRIIPNFMIQGGDPRSKGASSGEALGRGGPGYTVPAEMRSQYVHTKGALAAARTSNATNPEKASSGSQFYIVHGKDVDAKSLELLQDNRGVSYTDEQIERYLELGGTPHLDSEYTVYGQVIEGLDVIDKIARVQTNRRDRPEEDVEMRVKVIK